MQQVSAFDTKDNKWSQALIKELLPGDKALVHFLFWKVR